jgi:uncharacterized YccA/Bax inhibitor family protein
MRTSNPAMQAFVHQDIYRGGMAGAAPRVMTYRGTILAASILTALCAISAVATWDMMAGGGSARVFPWLIGSLIGTVVLALVMHARPQTAPFVSPVYAIGEGVFVGALSYLIPLMYDKVGTGVIIQAVVLTFGILLALLAAFSVGLVRLGSTAVKVITVATAGVAIYYVAGMLFQMIGVTAFPRLGWEGGMLGIGFSLFVVVLASLNLVLDFQFIEAGVQNRAPKYMEWYGAYGLLVTVVWLYIETLRLLAKLRE